ncbi:MAG: hypothetical protein Q9165_007968 [Trypethelium subeluteriae]
MSSVLAHSGVTWETTEQRFWEPLREGIAEMSCAYGELRWALHTALLDDNARNEHKDFARGLTLKLHQMDSSLDFLDDATVTLQRTLHGTYDVSLVQCSRLISGPFDIARGTVVTTVGEKSVRLLVLDTSRKILPEVLFFHSSHVQCFIGAFAAGHLGASDAYNGRSTVWKHSGSLIPDTDLQEGTRQEYEALGWRFDPSLDIPRSNASDDLRSILDSQSHLVILPYRSPRSISDYHNYLQFIKALRWRERASYQRSYHSSKRAPRFTLFPRHNPPILSHPVRGFLDDLWREEESLDKSFARLLKTHGLWYNLERQKLDTRYDFTQISGNYS